MKITLRFVLPPDSVKRLLQHPLFGGSALKRHADSVYWDTPEFALRQQDLIFRLRHADGKWTQTIKRGGDLQAGRHQRTEVETALHGAQPDFSALTAMQLSWRPGTPEPDAIPQRLRPMFATSFTRITKIIRYKTLAKIGVTIDRGNITSAAAAMPICDLRLELKAGTPTSIFDFALALLDDIPFTIENRSKAERGFALLNHEKPSVTRLRVVQLAPTVPAIAALVKIAVTLLTQIQANWRGVLDGDNPEYLHRMRVAVRRLRTLLNAYARVLPETEVRPFIADVQWLGHALGSARDADVFMIEIWPPLRDALYPNPLLDVLEVHWADQRRKVKTNARRALKSRRYQRFMLAFGRWLIARNSRAGASKGLSAAFDRSTRDFARDIIEYRDRKVRKRGRGRASMDDARLHKLRIQVKKLRYSMESFASLFEKGTAHGFAVQLARLQDILGALNDTGVAQRLMAKALVGKHGRAATKLRSGLAAWHDARCKTLHRKLHAAWRAYRNAQQFW